MCIYGYNIIQREFIFLQEPIHLDKCVICWEQDWEDYFEIQEFIAKEAFIFKVRNSVVSV